MTISAILAPVPCIHVSNGLDTCLAHGRVAFGSNATRFFLDSSGKCTIESGSKFFITATRPEHGCGYLNSPGKAAFEADFVQWTPANNRGKHPNQNLRPSSTRDDTAFLGFWEVSGLQALLKPIQFSSFLIEGTGASMKSMNVLGPVKVTVADK